MHVRMTHADNIIFILLRVCMHSTKAFAACSQNYSHFRDSKSILWPKSCTPQIAYRVTTYRVDSGYRVGFSWNQFILAISIVRIVLLQGSKDWIQGRQIERRSVFYTLISSCDLIKQLMDSLKITKSLDHVLQKDVIMVGQQCSQHNKAYHAA